MDISDCTNKMCSFTRSYVERTQITQMAQMQTSLSLVCASRKITFGKPPSASEVMRYSCSFVVKQKEIASCARA